MSLSQDSAAERHSKAQDATRVRLQDDLERLNVRIHEIETQINIRDEEITYLRQQNEDQKKEEQMDAVALRNETGEKAPRNIAPEDALDTIIRLENAAKLAQRRNALFEKELGIQQRALKEKTKELDATKKVHHELLQVTGFSANSKSEDVDKLREDIEEMERLETSLAEEVKTARVIIRKKQQLVETLQAEVDVKKSTEELLFALYNDIRVKDRDVVQAEADLEDMKRQDRKRNSALALAEDRRDVVALSCLEKDKDFLKREVQRCRDKVRQQELVQKKQIQRQLQLQARLDMIQAAFKDMGWEKEFESTLSNAIISTDAIGEPDDEDRIFPPNEEVAAEVFELLRQNNDEVTSSLARKDILLLEKQAVVQAMEDKVEKATLKHNVEAKQQMIEDRHRLDEVQLRQEQLTVQLADYRAQIDALTRKNLKLRSQIEKVTKESLAK